MTFSQEKLVDFDNQEVVRQPTNLLQCFFPKINKEQSEAEEQSEERGKQEQEPAPAETAENGNKEPAEKAENSNKEPAEPAEKDNTETAEKGNEPAETGNSEPPIEDEEREAANIATRQTFQSMGLRCAKRVAEHLLLENAYESNLLPDISRVDYLEGNLGRTNLRPLEGLPPFIDDLYTFGYFSRDECVVHRGKLCYTSGEEGAAKLVVRSIANALERALGKTKPIPVAIVHTVAVSQTESSTIRSTIARIEKDTAHSAKEKWKQIHPGKEIAGYFVAKCDVSEISLQSIHAGLYVFKKCLEGYGYGIYSIDYTQDFSGVLDREALVAYLGFQKQGDFCTAIAEETPTILENTKTVGNHVCTWIETTEEERASRTKVYNKVVSNFEAGEIRQQVGGHLADYVDCPNLHLRQTFQHPDVQTRGCTRIEVSLYAPKLEELSSEKAADIIRKVLQKVSAEEEEDGVFVVQPPSKQWQNLAKNLDRCLVLADRPQGNIIVGWYGHTVTGRISGVHVNPKPAKVQEEKKWERAVLWAAGDFGFRKCPIFRVDILAADEQGVEIGPLRCYMKGENSRTILVGSKKPTQLHPNGPDLSKLLPPTDMVEWEWRDKKCHAIGSDSSKYSLQEIKEIADKRQISTLSTVNRAKRLAELCYSRTVEKWRRNRKQIVKKEHKRLLEAEKARQAELTNLQKYAEKQKKIQAKSWEIRATVIGALSGETKKVAELQNDLQWDVLGFRRKDEKYRAVLRHSKEAPVVVWATKGLQKIILHCLDSFRTEEKKDCNGRELFWLVYFTDLAEFGGLSLRIEDSKSFQNQEGQTIVWNPIQVLSAPDSRRIEELQTLRTKSMEYESLRVELAKNFLQKISAPSNKNIKKTTDLPEGEYICKRFAETTFRKARRTILFLLPLGEDGEPKTDEETPTHGVFLEKTINEMGGLAVLKKRREYLRCWLGEEKTTPSKRKCRRVAIT